LEKGDVKLVVLDSIAAMFRAEHSGQEQDFTKRSPTQPLRAYAQAANE